MRKPKAKCERYYSPEIDCYVRLNRRMWELLVVPHVWGFCQKHRSPKRMLVITDHRRDVRGLDTFLHECLHAICPERGEMWVHRRAYELSRILWKCGLRFKTYPQQRKKKK